MICRFIFCLALPLLCSLPVKLLADSASMSVSVDATDITRKLLHATVTIPLATSGGSGERTVALWYPKWVPGSHGPGGPIANVAGLKITDDRGTPLRWERTAGEVYRIVVTVPEDAASLNVRMRYITNQPTTNSMGHDSFGSPMLGVVSFGTVLMYPEGSEIDEQEIQATLKLPPNWKASTALHASKGVSADDELRFAPVTMRTLVDSPVMCGLHRRIFDLVEPEHAGTIPPHRLHVFSEAESAVNLHPEILQKLRKMVTQAALLFGSHPFEEFDILLATSDVLSPNGLEHSRSTFNIVTLKSLRSPESFKGWMRLLVPHEYVHAWCGKYRRPTGMLTPDFHSPKDTGLLWVYEGLTQYLGELLEVRSDLMDADEFRDRITIELGHAVRQQGRDWRSLRDTSACSHILRARSRSWGRLRRSQDYYMEGMLFWLEADALIRSRSDGEKSLDDFCQAFFRAEANAPAPRPFSRDDVVQQLSAVLDYDWDGLIARRIESLQIRFDPQVADSLGYAIQFSNERPDIPGTTFRGVMGLDAYDSLGISISAEGEIRDLLLGSAADKAGLGPGMRMMGVNGFAWSENRFHDAIVMSPTRGDVELLVKNGDSFKTHRVEYSGGPRYMVLVRKPETNDLLAEILQPR